MSHNKRWENEPWSSCRGCLEGAITEATLHLLQLSEQIKTGLVYQWEKCDLLKENCQQLQKCAAWIFYPTILSQELKKMWQSSKTTPAWKITKSLIYLCATALDISETSEGVFEDGLCEYVSEISRSACHTRQLSASAQRLYTGLFPGRTLTSEWLQDRRERSDCCVALLWRGRAGLAGMGCMHWLEETVRCGHRGGIKMGTSQVVISELCVSLSQSQFIAVILTIVGISSANEAWAQIFSVVVTGLSWFGVETGICSDVLKHQTWHVH